MASKDIARVPASKKEHKIDWQLTQCLEPDILNQTSEMYINYQTPPFSYTIK